MKSIQSYIPFLLIAAAGVAGVYFLWYKPKQEKQEADQAAAQAASNAEVTAYNPAYMTGTLGVSGGAYPNELPATLNTSNMH